MNHRKPIHLCDIRAVHFILQINTVGEMIPELRNTPNLYEYWMLFAFFMMLAILAYVRVAYTRRLYRLFSSLVRIQILRQVMREELVFSHRVSVLLFLNFSLAGGLILFCAAKFYGWNVSDFEGWQRYLLIVGALAGAYLLKLLIANFMRRIFNDRGLIKEYLFEVFLVNKAIGVLFLPFSIAVCFINVGKLNLLFSVVGMTFGLFLIFRLIQGLRMSLSYPVSRVYIILYLCTLEILPFLVVWHLFNIKIA